MLARENKVKQRVQEGNTALGFVCRTLSPVVVELIGLSGFDFVWIDMEHTGADFATVENLCRAAEATGIETLVRVPDKNPTSILRALEVGATIVNVPQVEEPGEAEAVVRAAKYAPLGQRGFCSSSRGLRYGFDGEAQDAFAAANLRTMTMVQIESARGVENARKICSVPGLDAIFIGLADLSQSLGITGQLEHPDLVDSARRVLETGKAAGKITAVLVATSEDATKWVKEGAQILCCGVDIPAISKALLRIRGEFESFRS
ncbi:MAG TPA: aldolase/citrate lyase family protein [Pyrinomonadaceae bacterium]|nr:aldolase/citrate lyase family protein [Pyrinomonadaceae bacterium]